MQDILRLARVVVATLTLAVVCNLSLATAQDSQSQTVTDLSPTGELTFWNGIKDSNDVGSFKTYLKNFPNGMFYDIALAKYHALGGSSVDVKPAANGGANNKTSVKNLPLEKGSNSKVENAAIKKQHAPVLMKKIVRYTAHRKAPAHLVKKSAHKGVVIKSKRIVKRKSIAPPREGGGGGSGGGSHWG